MNHSGEVMGVISRVPEGWSLVVGRDRIGNLDVLGLAVPTQRNHLRPGPFQCKGSIYSQLLEAGRDRPA